MDWEDMSPLIAEPEQNLEPEPAASPAGQEEHAHAARGPFAAMAEASPLSGGPVESLERSFEETVKERREWNAVMERMAAAVKERRAQARRSLQNMNFPVIG